ncbi:hypothetical protein QB910_000022 [Dabrowskivirus KKP3916]|uniref:Major capsid protein n=1 Tax=Alicyclobacillus phage KKP_3916 TaxID=3040651 RepID=A0AAT9V7I6_9CAUD|nr:hypothetical protein QB910_000022 [Alicyclobacillus phage KKP 3916]
MKNELVKLGIDLAHNATGEFSQGNPEVALRNGFKELIGSDKLDYKTMRRNGALVFEAMEEILEVLITEGLEDQFNEFVDIRNLALGDREFFTVDDYHLFNVGIVSQGNGDTRRQRLGRTTFTVDTDWRSVKIYDNLAMFIAGRINWGQMIAKVGRSFNAQIAADIYSAIVAGYNTLQTPYLYNGTADRVQLLTLAEHIRAATDQDVTVFGTKLALQQFTPQFVQYGGDMIDQRNQDAFFRVIDGLKMVEIKQSHVPGTDSFAVADNFLLVIPNGEQKIIKMVLEGEPIVRETPAGVNMDDSIEYEFRKKYGLMAITSTKYGAYLIS